MNRQIIGERLKQARENANISRKEVSEIVGIGTTTLQQWEVGSREASIEALESLASLYNVSPQYLIFGYESTPKDKSVDNDEYAYIPSFDMSASAGRGEHLKTWQVSKKLAFRRDWLLAKDLDSEQLSCIHVKGDSMEPTIPNDATILVDTRYINALDGGISVLTIDSRIFVKRTQWQANGDLMLISDNARYSDVVIAEDDLLANKVSVYGQVVHISYDLPH